MENVYSNCQRCGTTLYIEWTVSLQTVYCGLSRPAMCSDTQDVVNIATDYCVKSMQPVDFQIIKDVL